MNTEEQTVAAPKVGDKVKVLDTSGYLTLQLGATGEILEVLGGDPKVYLLHIPGPGIGEYALIDGEFEVVE